MKTEKVFQSNQRVLASFGGDWRICSFVCYATIHGRHQAIVIASRPHGRPGNLYYFDPDLLRPVTFDAAGNPIIGVPPVPEVGRATPPVACTLEGYKHSPGFIARLLALRKQVRNEIEQLRLQAAVRPISDAQIRTLAQRIRDLETTDANMTRQIEWENS